MVLTARIDKLDHDPVEDEVFVDIPANGRRPTGWNFLCFKTLKQLVKDAGGAASEPVLKFINTYLQGTKLIFVVGVSGTGKTTLLTEITEQQLVVGKGHTSGIVDDEQYLFIDTAGFGAFDTNDMHNFHDIMACLDVLGPFVTIAGALLVCSAAEQRLTAAELRTIQWLQCFCGPDFYRNITVVVTKWDFLSLDGFEDKWNNPDNLYTHGSINDILHPPSVGQTRYHGGTLYHHALDFRNVQPEQLPQQLSTLRPPGSALRTELVQAMIKERYGGKIPTPKLQIYRELANKVDLDETEAAKVLKWTGTPTEPFLTLRIQDGFTRISVQQGSGSGVKDKAKISSGEDEPSMPKTSWRDSVLQWVTMAYKAAAFFRQAKNARRRNPGEARPRSTAWVRIVEGMRDWWNGPNEDGHDDEFEGDRLSHME